MAVNTLKFLPGEEFQAVLPDGRECRLNWEDFGRVALGLGGLGTNHGSVQSCSEIKTVCHNYIANGSSLVMENTQEKWFC